MFHTSIKFRTHNGEKSPHTSIFLHAAFYSYFRKAKTIPMKKIFLSLLAASLFIHAFSQTAPPKVLIVIAHPDDESAFSATVYKITHELKGTVDLLMVTNGEGG